MILDPVRLGPLQLRNRIVKAATNEGMGPDRLARFHGDIARNGVGLTTVAYAAVDPGGRTFANQLLLDAASVGPLSRLTDAVHEAGGAASVQLAHCGGFTKLVRPMGPSRGINPYGLAKGRGRIRAMSERDIADVIAAFARAARLARDAGFDAVEVHLGHGYLLSQFLSPLYNRRRDRWRGRALPLEVVRAVREAVPELAVLAKINLSDGVKGGATIDDAIALAKEIAPFVDGIIPSGGLVQRSAFYLLRGTTPRREMAAVQAGLDRVAMRLLGRVLMKQYPFRPSFFFEDASRVLDAVDVAVGLLGGVDDLAGMNRALERGFAFVVLGRALLADPDLVARIEAGEDFRTRCTRCNRCIVEMDRNGTRCVISS